MPREIKKRHDTHRTAASLRQTQKEYLQLFAQIVLLTVGLPVGYFVLAVCTAGRLRLQPWYNDSVGFELSRQRIVAGWSQGKTTYRCTPELASLIGIGFAGLFSGVWMLFLASS